MGHPVTPAGVTILERIDEWVAEFQQTGATSPTATMAEHVRGVIAGLKMTREMLSIRLAEVEIEAALKPQAVKAALQARASARRDESPL